MEKSIAYKQKQGFLIEGGKWHYEGDKVKVMAKNQLDEVISIAADVLSVCEDVDAVILEKDGTKYRIDLHSILKIDCA